MASEEQDTLIDIPSTVSTGANLVGMHNYLAMWERSVNEPQDFWMEQALKHLDWIIPPKTTMRGGFETGDVAWFPDGFLNVSVNCLDRHPPDQTAIIWEGDNPADVERHVEGSGSSQQRVAPGGSSERAKGHD